ncbi:protein ACCELERATED CELL DEATH 6-like [Pistacia vera]|uniref:protein ACCELERATED CELL DEATH 6-like n=1 Tax=Pistacia vera TaxID=55513 RepID=UPI001262DAA8|nr:protein ACCELERATED CELL DEATH 6-like [Pistacia vera]
MDLHLFKAAVEGNVEPFSGNHQNLEQVVTHLRDTILHVNIKCQNEAMASTIFVDQILTRCPSLSLQVNANGDTPLHVAAKCGNSTMVEVLFRHSKAQPGTSQSGGLNPVWEMLKMTNKEENAALHEAVQYGSLEVVKVLTREGDPDFSYSANSYGETPLYLAAARGSPEMVVAILGSCRAVAHEGPGGKTALHAAAMSRNSGTAREILEKKKCLTKETDQYGWTPLHYAAYYNLTLNTEVLLEFDESAAFIPDKDRKMTPLHVASSQGCLKVIEKILLHSPQCYELVDNRGWNFLHFAMVSLHEKDVDVLQQNPLVRSLIHHKDAKGNTPLHVLAASKRNYSFELNSINLKHKSSLRVINRQNISVEHILSYGFPELEQEIQALTQEVCNGQRPRGVICSSREPLSEDLLGVEKAREPHLVVAALIATVTFAAGFTMPGGYQSEKGQDQGTAILSRKSAFQFFIVADSIAMSLSVSSVFIHFVMSLKFLQNLVSLFFIAHYLTVFAMVAMVFAFISGTWAVLPPSVGLGTAIMFICLNPIALVSALAMREKEANDEARKQKLLNM